MRVDESSTRLLSELLSTVMDSYPRLTPTLCTLIESWALSSILNTVKLWMRVDESFTLLLSDSCQLSWTLILVCPHAWKLNKTLIQTWSLNSHTTLMLAWPGFYVTINLFQTDRYLLKWLSVMRLPLRGARCSNRTSIFSLNSLASTPCEVKTSGLLQLFY